MTSGILSQCAMVIVSHVFSTGHSQELESFLRHRVQTLAFIGHPFHYAHSTNSFAVLYEKGHVIKNIKGFAKRGPEILFYVMDFLITFYFIARSKRRFDVYVGVDPLNALTGLILKKMGVVKTTIFYTIDYIPIRFSNLLLNAVYHFVDRLCVYSSDFTWNLSPAMTMEREKRGIRKELTNQFVVPTGTHYRASRKSIDRTSIAFLSHLREGQGIELILDAMPYIVRKIPSVKLMVIGTGPLEKTFRKEVKKRGLAGHVHFLGFVEDHKKVEEILSGCAIGIAPYVPDPKSFTWFADPSKPKVYLGCGLPVVITKVPLVAFEIDRNRAGIAINYNKNEFIEAIMKLLTDDFLYERYRKNALELASKFKWEKIFENAFLYIRSVARTSHRCTKPFNRVKTSLEAERQIRQTSHN